MCLGISHTLSEGPLLSVRGWSQHRHRWVPWWPSGRDWPTLGAACAGLSRRMVAAGDGGFGDAWLRQRGVSVAPSAQCCGGRATAVPRAGVPGAGLALGTGRAGLSKDAPRVL